MANHQQIFNNIYDNNVWIDRKGNSLSGPGSNLEYNIKTYIPFLKKFIKDNSIKTVVDLGCGDLFCGKHIYDDLNITYHGYDIYQSLIQTNSEKYKDSKYNFHYLNFYEDRDKIVSADLCIIKDVLQHWSLNEIYTFMDFLVNKKIFKFIIVCNCSYQKEDNTNIIAGSFRPLSSKFLPLKKYSPKILFTYHTKEVSLIECNDNKFEDNKFEDKIVISILAKDKEACLPYYLRCIEKQTFPKDRTYLYIRTNNNNDRTAVILEEWIEKVKDQYLDIYFDKTDVPENIQKYKQHEWNVERFKILGKIRNDSIKFAMDKKCHYFVADLDNFIYENTITELMKTNLPVIGPMLRKSNYLYANYHHQSNEWGYFKKSDGYFNILDKHIKGLIQVSTIHCTYLIRYEVLQYANYDDNSNRYEYAILSDGFRRHNIPQYVDNRVDYGWLTFAENKEELMKDPMFDRLVKYTK